MTGATECRFAPLTMMLLTHISFALNQVQWKLGADQKFSQTILGFTIGAFALCATYPTLTRWIGDGLQRKRIGSRMASEAAQVR